MLRFLPVCLLIYMAARVPSAEGRTWNIYESDPGDAPTVQAGIDSAAVGDTVLVYPGTYHEVIDFLGKDIVVRSAMGAEVTALDGTGFTGVAVVTFQSGETRAARLEGMAVMNGERGILVAESEPTIIGNVITKNGSVSAGAGIWCGAAIGVWSPLIQANDVTLNVSTNIAGGIGTWNRMTAAILDNHVADNQAIAGDGGGIYYRGWHDGGVIRNNTIENNSAGDHGGGFYAASAMSGVTYSFEFSWNLVSNNTADGGEETGNSGGGVWLWGADASVHHNTIVGNTGNGTNNMNGGGVVLDRPSTPVLEKNIIAFSGNGGGLWCGGGVTPIIRNNLFWQNLPSDDVGTCPDWLQSDGNLVADPYFCNATAGIYTLAADSPALLHSEGPLGSFDAAGCGPVPTLPSTWGALKARFRTGGK